MNPDPKIGTVKIDTTPLAGIGPKLEEVAAATKALMDALNDLPPEVRKMAKVELATRILVMD